MKPKTKTIKITEPTHSDAKKAIIKTGQKLQSFCDDAIKNAADKIRKGK